ncbi:hypothetical protein Tco_0847788 [Tanacetum coccineum]
MIDKVLLLHYGQHVDAKRNGWMDGDDDSQLREQGARRDHTVTRECDLPRLHEVPTSGIFKGTEESGLELKPMGLERMDRLYSRISKLLCGKSDQVLHLYSLAGATDVVEFPQLELSTTNVSRNLALLCVRMFPEESDKVERYVRPSKVMEKVGSIAYKAWVSSRAEQVHFVGKPLEIVGREVLNGEGVNSRIPLVKVRWNSKRGPEFTWEREDQFKKNN